MSFALQRVQGRMQDSALLPAPNLPDDRIDIESIGLANLCFPISKLVDIARSSLGNLDTLERRILAFKILMEGLFDCGFEGCQNGTIDAIEIALSYVSLADLTDGLLTKLLLNIFYSSLVNTGNLNDLDAPQPEEMRLDHNLLKKMLAFCAFHKYLGIGCRINRIIQNSPEFFLLQQNGALKIGALFREYHLHLNRWLYQKPADYFEASMRSEKAEPALMGQAVSCSLNECVNFLWREAKVIDEIAEFVDLVEEKYKLSEVFCLSERILVAGILNETLVVYFVVCITKLVEENNTNLTRNKLKALFGLKSLLPSPMLQDLFYDKCVKIILSRYEVVRAFQKSLKESLFKEKDFMKSFIKEGKFFKEIFRFSLENPLVAQAFFDFYLTFALEWIENRNFNYQFGERILHEIGKFDQKVDLDEEKKTALIRLIYLIHQKGASSLKGNGDDQSMKLNFHRAVAQKFPLGANTYRTLALANALELLWNRKKSISEIVDCLKLFAGITCWQIPQQINLEVNDWILQLAGLIKSPEMIVALVGSLAPPLQQAGAPFLVSEERLPQILKRRSLTLRDQIFCISHLLKFYSFSNSLTSLSIMALIRKIKENENKVTHKEFIKFLRLIFSEESPLQPGEFPFYSAIFQPILLMDYTFHFSIKELIQFDRFRSQERLREEILGVELIKIACAKAELPFDIVIKRFAENWIETFQDILKKWDRIPQEYEMRKRIKVLEQGKNLDEIGLLQTSKERLKWNLIKDRVEGLMRYCQELLPAFIRSY